MPTTGEDTIAPGPGRDRRISARLEEGSALCRRPTLHHGQSHAYSQLLSFKNLVR